MPTSFLNFPKGYVRSYSAHHIQEHRHKHFEVKWDGALLTMTMKGPQLLIWFGKIS